MVHVSLYIHSTDKMKPGRDNEGSDAKPSSSAQQWSIWTANVSQIPAPV